MSTFEKDLQDSAIYSNDEYKEAKILDILRKNKLHIQKQYMGQLSRVYRILDAPWVIKEARWDLSMELFAGKHIPLPARIASKILKLFSFTFLPDKKEILSQYNQYLEFAQYFGYFENDKVYYHPNRNIIFNSQKQIRSTLLFYKEQLEKKYKFKLNKKIEDVLNDKKVVFHNFLPKEYLLIGESVSKENKGKVTSLIVQEFIEGEVLRDYDIKKLSELNKKKLILLTYLMLLMNLQVGLLPDTRPRYHVLEAYDWLTRTDNVILSTKDFKFVDTRWFWDTQSNIIKRGVVIPELAIDRAKLTINNLLKELK